MSEENVEIVRRGLDAFASGDVETALSDLDGDAVICRREPETHTWSGPDGMLAAVADWTEGFDRFEISGEDYIDAGDVVVARIHQLVRGQTSGATVEGDSWFVYLLRDRRVVRVDMFTTRAKALAAAGLDG